MRLMSILMFLLAISAIQVQTSFARSPAVLDFVGIEPEGFGKKVPQGLVPAYNFESGKDFATRTPQSENQSNMKVMPENGTFTFSSLLAIFAVIALPFMTWFMIQAQMERKKLEAQIQSEEILAKYRTIHEQTKSQDKDDDDQISKAS
jgi:hypothetical protein